MVKIRLAEGAKTISYGVIIAPIQKEKMIMLKRNFKKDLEEIEDNIFNLQKTPTVQECYDEFYNFYLTEGIVASEAEKAVYLCMIHISDETHFDRTFLKFLKEKALMEIGLRTVGLDEMEITNGWG